MGALDGDSTGTLAYKKSWKIIEDSYAFSNAIRLIVHLNTGKFGNILSKFILFLQNMILKKAIRSISYDNRQILHCF